MCSYKVWIWLTAIYSIPLILVLILTDIVTLVGLNAPQLFKYDNLDKTELMNGIVAGIHQDRFLDGDDLPKFGETIALHRIAYENQFKRNFNQDNNLDDIANNELIDRNESDILNESNDNLKDNSPENLNDKLISEEQTIKLTDDEQATTKSTKDEQITTSSTLTNEKTTIKNDNQPERTVKPNDDKNTTPIDDDNEDKDGDKGDKKGKGDKDKKDDKDGDKGDKGDKDDKDDKDPSPDTSRELNKSLILKKSWNEFIQGIHDSNDKKLVLNIFVLIKLGFRVFLLISLPLLIIGNSKDRSKYIKPFKILLLLQFLFSLSIFIYYAVVSTQCQWYRDINDWLPKHFEEPDEETGRNVSKLFLLITFFDIFPYFCIISLILLNKRDRQINKKKEEAQQENWDLQLRPLGLPRIKNTANNEHISPLNLHFNQTANHNDSLPITAGLITNEEISVNNQPFSYTHNNTNQSLNNQTQFKYEYDNQAFNKN